MYDRGLGVLEQYGLTAETVLRGRGALICQTEKDGKVSANIGAPREAGAAEKNTETL